MTNAIGTGGGYNWLGVNINTATAPTEPVGGGAAQVDANTAQPTGDAGVSTQINWDPANVALDKDVQIPPMWPVGDKPLDGRTFTSWGDPHEITGDGLHFDNQRHGEFVKLMSATGDFVLQTRQETWVKNNKVTVNTAAAIAMGNDLVAFEMKDNTLRLNGNKVPATPGATYDMPDGGKVECKDGLITITSAKGDVVNIELKDSYINIRGELSASRKDGEVRGSLGSFDNDTSASNDLKGRDGKTYNAADPQSLNAFFDDWQAHIADSLFSRSEDMAFFNESLDLDGDGTVGKNELNTYFQKAYDIDGDGTLSRQEFLVGRASRRADLDAGLGSVENAPAGTQQFGNRGAVATNRAAAPMRKYDANKDGKLTSAEYFGGLMGWNIGDFLKGADKEDEEQKAKERKLRERRKLT